MIHNKKLWAIRATRGNKSMITSYSRERPVIKVCFSTKEAAERVLQFYKENIKFVSFKIVEFEEK